MDFSSIPASDLQPREFQPASDLQPRESSPEVPAKTSRDPSLDDVDVVWISAQDPTLQSKEQMMDELMEDPLGIPDQSLKDPRRPSNFDLHDADPFDYLEVIWNEEDSKVEDNVLDDDEDICVGAGYVTPPPVTTTDEEDSDTESDDVSTEDSSSKESDEEARHRSRIIDLMLEWMAYTYATKIEEELIYLRNCDGNIFWTHSRFAAFKLLCQEEIMDTRQQILEGSIVIPISKEETHTHE